MTEERRLDLSVGAVPDYRTFVRHLWGYRAVHGFQISPPPVMYCAVFDDVDHADSDWEAIRSLVQSLTEEFDLHDYIEWENTGLKTWELRFGSLKALHVFCVSLGDRARIQEDEAAIRVGEFIMWTLGFRWV